MITSRLLLAVVWDWRGRESRKKDTIPYPRSEALRNPSSTSPILKMDSVGPFCTRSQALLSAVSPYWEQNHGYPTTGLQTLHGLYPESMAAAAERKR